MMDCSKNNTAYLELLPPIQKDLDYVTLTFPGIPKAVQSFRFRNAGKFATKYQPKETIEWKNYIKLLAFEQLPYDFETFHDCAIAIEVIFVFPVLKSFTKKLTKSIVEDGKIVFHTKKPDLSDNLMKGLNDALTGTVWKDDNMIADTHSRKIYGPVPQTVMRVTRIG